MVTDDNTLGNGDRWFKVSNAVIDEQAARIGVYGLAVLLVLMRHADAKGKSFPSIGRIANLTALSRSSVLRTLRKLEEFGVIKTRKRKTRSGDKDANLYSVYPLAGGSVPQTPRGVTGTPGSVPQTPGVVSNRHQGSVPQTPEGIPIEQDPLEQDPINKTASLCFEEFWGVYLRKEEKAKALQEWKNTTRGNWVDPQALITAAKNYSAYHEARGTDLRYVKFPATFLSKRTRIFDEWQKPRKVESNAATNGRAGFSAHGGRPQVVKAPILRV